MERFINVWCIHNAGSIKMSHSADLSMSFASESQRDLLKRSTNPFVCGRYGVNQWCLTQNFSVSFSTTSLTNSIPLSICRCVKHPKWQIIFWYKKFEMLKAFASLTALAFCYLDRYFTVTTMYRFPFGIIGKGPTASTPHWSKSLDSDIRCSSLILCIGFFIWHW